MKEIKLDTHKKSPAIRGSNQSTQKMGNSEPSPIGSTRGSVMDKKLNQWEISPVRTLDDFVLESARFQVPNINDLEKWGNRVVQNLLYYQTNYFILALIIFLIVGMLHPVEMCSGIIAVGIAFGLFYYFTNATRSAARIKKDYPILSIFLILGGGYFIVYLLGSVLVFLFGVLLPVMVIFIHASMRLRNLKNKFANKIEVIGLRRTPMGIFLESLGEYYDTAALIYQTAHIANKENIKK